MPPAKAPFTWHGTWDEFNAQVRERWQGQPVTAHIGHPEAAPARPEAVTPPHAPGSTPLKAAIWYAVTHAIRHAEERRSRGGPVSGQAATPGQAAYTASSAVLRGDLKGTPWAWSSLPNLHVKAWEAAAEAAIEAAGLRGQLAVTQAIARAMQATAIEILGRFRQSGPAYTATASASPEQLARWRAVLGGDEAMTEAADLRGQLAQAQAELRVAELSARAAEAIARMRGADIGAPPEGSGGDGGSHGR